MSIAASRGLGSPDRFNMSTNHENEDVPVGFLFIDVLCDFDMKGIVIVWLCRGGNSGDKKLEL